MTNEYEVECILGEKRVKQRGGRRKTLYHVKWVGFDDTTWEPLANLLNCRDKIDEFKARPMEATAAAEGDDASHEEEETKEEVVREEEKEDEDENEEDADDAADATEDWDYNMDGDTGENACGHSEGEEVEATEEIARDCEVVNSTKRVVRRDNVGRFLDSDGESDMADDDDEEVVVIDKGKNADLDDLDHDDLDETVYTAIAGPHKTLKDEALRSLSDKFVPAYYGDSTEKSGEDIDPYMGKPKVSDGAEV
jgi:hypothetical protein